MFLMKIINSVLIVSESGFLLLYNSQTNQFKKIHIKNIISFNIFDDTYTPYNILL